MELMKELLHTEEDDAFKHLVVMTFAFMVGALLIMFYPTFFFEENFEVSTMGHSATIMIWINILYWYGIFYFKFHTFS